MVKGGSSAVAPTSGDVAPHGVRLPRRETDAVVPVRAFSRVDWI